MGKWVKSKYLIAGKLPSVRNTTNMNMLFPEMKAEYEYAAIGKYGEIWENGPGTYKVVVLEANMAGRVARVLGDPRSFKFGEVGIFNLNDFNVLKIAKMVQISGVKAVERANNFRNL